jgi:hypothetical protein
VRFADEEQPQDVEAVEHLVQQEFGSWESVGEAIEELTQAEQHVAVASSIITRHGAFDRSKIMQMVGVIVMLTGMTAQEVMAAPKEAAAKAKQAAQQQKVAKPAAKVNWESPASVFAGTGWKIGAEADWSQVASFLANPTVDMARQMRVALDTDDLLERAATEAAFQLRQKFGDQQTAAMDKLKQAIKPHIEQLAQRHNDRLRPVK